MTDWGRILASASWSLAALASVGTLAWLYGTQALPPEPENDPDAIRRDGTLAATLPDRTCRMAGLGWTCRYLDLSNRTLVENDAKPDLLKPFAEDGALKNAQRKMVALDLQGRTLRFADFTGAQLFSADLRHIRGEHSTWIEAQLAGANLSRSSLQGADLSEASLHGADLAFASLQGAILTGANLEGADLSKASLQGASLGPLGAYLLLTSLDGAYLSGASLQWVTGKAMGCHRAQFLDLNTKPISGADLAAQLKKEGLTDERIAAILARIDKEPAATCEGQPLGQTLPPSDEDFAKARIAAACEHAAAAAAISARSFDTAFFAAWKAETCPAVMAAKRKRGEVR